MKQVINKALRKSSLKRVSLLSLFIILIFSCHQRGDQKKHPLTGDWIEVRRDDESGKPAVFPDDHFYKPMEFSFNDDGTGTFFNPVTVEPKTALPYKITGDSILEFGRDYKIIELNNDKLILKIPYGYSFAFIRKEQYNKLSKADIDKYKLATHGDSVYYDSIMKSRPLGVTQLPGGD